MTERTEMVDLNRPASNGKEINQSGLLDAIDVSALLRKACDDAGSQKAFASRAGVSAAFVHAVLSAKSAPSGSILRAIGLRKITRYTKIKG